MKNPIVGGFFLVACTFICAGQEESPVLEGDYLGQKPPGLTPEIFAPSILSTDKTELGCSFSPDGNEVFFTEWNAGKNTLMTMKRENGRWTKRAVASFSGDYSDVDPYFSADGERLYFSSTRPLEKGGDPKDSDIWYVERNEDGAWRAPVHLGLPNSPGKDDYYTSIARNRTLYSSIFDAHGSPGNLYKSYWGDGAYTAPQLLDGMNTEFSEHDPFIAPDESYLIFASTRRGGFGREDLYISYREADGSWTEPKNMGKTINSSGFDFCPMLSPDGKYLFFTRNINRNGDIYWVDSKIIEELNPSRSDSQGRPDVQVDSPFR